MPASRPLKLWLNAQCQMFGNVSSAMLVRTLPDSTAILAKWPDQSIDTALLTSIVSTVVEKQRLQLQLLENNHYLFGHPLIINGECWGIFVVRLNLPNKTALPALLKSLKLGQFWLEFITQSGAAEPQHTSTPAIKNNEADPGAVPNALNASSGFKESINAALVHAHANLLKENSVAETCITFVNLLAGLMQASRVSLGLFDSRGKNFRLEAISFSASIDQRTQSMLAIREAMAEAIEQGVRIDCAATSQQPTDQSSLIIHSHQQLLRDQQAQRISTFLLRRGDVILGAVTLEFQRDSLNSDEEVLVQQLIHSAAAILFFQQRASQGFWQILKVRTLAWVENFLGKNAWRKKMAAAVATLFIVALFIPVDYQLSATANVQTMEKYLVVSPQDAYLGAISARPGDLITKGAVLAQLNDEDLRLERRKIASQAQQYRQAYDSALANSNRVDAAIASAQLDQASIQLQLLDQQLTRTQLLAPVDGIVVSDDIAQTRGAPVKQGDVLFEIAAQKKYLVQLFVDERDIAQLQPGQAGELKLTSLPAKIFTTRVKTITPISEVRDGRNYFRVELEFVEPESARQDEFSILRPGMTGIGKVYTGERLLGWVWFHDIWHWLRLSLW